ncbi:winged helix-turn-helix transcriptional regulator [Fusibacter sp. JL298sf-3]
MKIKKETYTCPMLLTRDLVGGKWKILVLWRLSKGTKRFSDLKREIPKITRKVLTEQLKDLVEAALVHREAYAEVPPKVEYSLTNKGLDFVPVLDAMATWGTAYLEDVDGGI